LQQLSAERLRMFQEDGVRPGDLPKSHNDCNLRFNHPGVMFAARIILPYFSVSAAMCLASASKKADISVGGATGNHSAA
jgi:hypothetical protein